jgi:GNAT superfamily N-acetyltransferase
MRLREIPPALYAREVLPLTAELWAGRRSFDEYVAQTLEIASSPYGRRYYRTVGLFDGRTLVASFKRYERIVHDGPRRQRAIGIGAVFTPSRLRGQGYASVMLALALDRARAEKYDLAYLFSDIRPQFYTALGFQMLPSREISLRADALPPSRLVPTRLTDRDWSGVRRTFERCEDLRRNGFSRSESVWQWIRTRMRHGSEHAAGHETNLIVRRGMRIAAYVLGVRAPERDAYIVDEFGFADESASQTVPALLRAAAGDLRRILGWLPPDGARRLLPRGVVKRRKRAIFMMLPLSEAGESTLRSATNAEGDFCWATDHI